MPPWAEEVWLGFWRLSRGRRYVTAGAAGPFGVRLRPLPLALSFLEIEAYAARLGLADEGFERFLDLVIRMDAAFLAESAEMEGRGDA